MSASALLVDVNARNLVHEAHMGAFSLDHPTAETMLAGFMAHFRRSSSMKFQHLQLSPDSNADVFFAKFLNRIWLDLTTDGVTAGAGLINGTLEMWGRAKMRANPRHCQPSGPKCRHSVPRPGTISFVENHDPRAFVTHG